MEVFKDVPNYEGLYQISSLGRIVNIKREKFLRPVLDKNYGYRTVMLTKDRKEQIHRVHRLVLWAFRGKSDLFGNHLDFNRQNNKLSNLEYVTAKENTRHAVLAGRHPTSKRRLSPEQVREIRKSDEIPSALALRFKIPASSIYAILKGQSYIDVK